ncbi:MAG: hypothetical protein KJ773_09645 [Candidatus Thermoplasmatota archaeon]|nr:hypothetical protein [Candidatus Thermoplasmatota archaeon]MBU4123849.1 hypothetical protein [Nanoarchaeota archaeon]
MSYQDFIETLPDIIDTFTEYGLFEKAKDGRLFCPKEDDQTIYILHHEPLFTPNSDAYHILVKYVYPGTSVLIDENSIGGGFG